MDPSKTLAIQQRPPPSNLKELQSILWLTNYYRKFIPNYSDIILAFRDLLLKRIPSNGHLNTQQLSNNWNSFLQLCRFFFNLTLLLQLLSKPTLPIMRFLLFFVNLILTLNNSILLHITPVSFKDQNSILV
jgi:hypothetical protein